MATVLAFSALVPAYGALPNIALGFSGSCTGWKSTIVPPDYIRVGRSDGSVDVVPFRKYVGVVSAREWPYWLPVAARRVGAIAVKQYGWYFALAGHHRYGFSSNGKCYDVTDSTRDQLYKPEKTSVRRATWRAVDYTWDVSLRKNGNFFMTGYRYGAAVSCGADADGRILYERSIRDCARQGKSTYTILKKYISGLTVLEGGTTTTSLAASAGPLAPASQQQSSSSGRSKPATSKPAAVAPAPAWTHILFPAPTVALELVEAVPAERQLAPDKVELSASSVLRGWMGPRIS